MCNSGDPSLAWVTIMKVAVGICVSLLKGWKVIFDGFSSIGFSISNTNLFCSCSNPLSNCVLVAPHMVSLCTSCALLLVMDSNAIWMSMIDAFAMVVRKGKWVSALLLHGKIMTWRVLREMPKKNSQFEALQQQSWRKSEMKQRMSYPKDPFNSYCFNCHSGRLRDNSLNNRNWFLAQDCPLAPPKSSVLFSCFLSSYRQATQRKIKNEFRKSLSYIWAKSHQLTYVGI